MSIRRKRAKAFLFSRAYDQSGLTVQEDYALYIFGVFAYCFLFLLVFLERL